MSPSDRTRVHFAEDPVVVVGTRAGPSDDDENKDSDQYYERMDHSKFYYKYVMNKTPS